MVGKMWSEVSEDKETDRSMQNLKAPGSKMNVGNVFFTDVERSKYSYLKEINNIAEEETHSPTYCICQNCG